MPCSNRGCLIKDAPGMRTNGPCHCLDRLPMEDKRILRHKILSARALYEAVNRMMAEIGAVGELSCRHVSVVAVMDVLHRIDGGAPDKFAF